MVKGKVMKTRAEHKISKSKKSNTPFFASGNKGGFFAVQAKLKTGNPGEKYEKEAAMVAQKVVNGTRHADKPFFSPSAQSRGIQEKPLAETITPLVQKQEEEEEEMQAKFEGTAVQMQISENEKEEKDIQMQQEEEEEEMQMKQDNNTIVPKAVETSLGSLQGGGRKLDNNVRSEMETGFGADFSNVNIHTGSDAVQMSKQMGAQAFTKGSDIYFNEGKYNPGTTQGKLLLAHELTHTIQQGGNNVPTSKTVPKVQKVEDKNADDLKNLSENDRFMTEDIRMMLCAMDFNQMYLLSANHSLASRNLGDAVKNKYLIEANKYSFAYNRYSNVIARAGKEAKNQNEWIAIGVSLGAGIGIGLLAAWALPATATAAFSLTASDALAVGVSSGIQGGLGTVVSSGISNAIKVPGEDLKPSGLSPEIIRTSVWQKAAEIYREGLSEIEFQKDLHYLNIMSIEVRRQIQKKLRGEDTRFNSKQLHKLAFLLNKARNILFMLKPIYVSRLKKQNENLSNIKSYSGPDALEMERGIWILWMSGIPYSESDILDLDEIEDYLSTQKGIGLLGPKSILGVDFGEYWTSQNDEWNAITAAFVKANRIKMTYKSLQGGGVDFITTLTPFTSNI
jgi:hypothetical protein